MKISVIRILLIFIILTESCNGTIGSYHDAGVKDNGGIVKRAERFSIQKKDGNILLTVINPWQGVENIRMDYHLVRRGSPIPEGLDSSEVIFVPLKKIICMSTTHIAMISALNEENSISAVSGPGYVFSENTIKNIEKGNIVDVGFDSGLNKELILSISPDLIMMYGVGSESLGYIGKIRELGVNVLFNADYLETDPIGKAEWIKLFGELYCKESLADSIFRSEQELYDSIKTYISENISSSPQVLLGLPYKDTWFVSPGNSFISKLISDAGGEYLWKNTESNVSMPFGLENVYLSALNADFWFNIGNVKSKNEIAVVDSRLVNLPCFISGNVYNNIKRSNLLGANDYWESGTVYPHLILKDIASILHPELFSRHDLYFYKKID